TTPDFGLCSSTHKQLTTTVTSPQPDRPTNLTRHIIKTIVDCWTGATLKEIDPNGNAMCTEYDPLGRVVATAVTGDSLLGLPDSTMEPTCAAGGSPTTWTKYLDLGVPGKQRTEVYAKNGGPATPLPDGGAGLQEGVYVKTFTDGLGREIQSCSQIDPTTHG